MKGTFLKSSLATLLTVILATAWLVVSSPVMAAAFQCPANIANCDTCTGSVSYFDQCSTVNGRCRNIGMCTTPDVFFYMCASYPTTCN